MVVDLGIKVKSMSEILEVNIASFGKHVNQINKQYHSNFVLQGKVTQKCMDEAQWCWWMFH